jgi:hypothetical protein
MQRLTDPDECRKITDKYPQYFTFDVENWFSQPGNYALIDGDNVGFGEYKAPGVYWVHFCFHTARGRDAIELTKRMLVQLKTDNKVTAIIGLIEKRNRKAKWLIRQVGLQSLGEVYTHNGLCEMFYTSTKEFT